MAHLTPTEDLEINGHAYLVFRNADASASDAAEEEIYVKDYFNDDGKFIENFEDILHRPDDLSVT